MSPRTLWRVTRAPYADLSGEGARRNGGRWNPVGVPMVYTSTVLALAALEYLVHTDPDLVPSDLVALPVQVPDGLMPEIPDPATLPADWTDEIAGAESQNFGAAWVREERSVLLLLPSALLPVVAAPAEANVLINSLHPDAARLRVGAPIPFSFDARLLA